ncbi:PspC domain-containing protein [Hugenholtzia roseola]|uniref:PspC domain-containing protein n=1 Tax=Hugenholtzia roseola TaxID=1002 RepID=UPI000554A4F2|nr:PspC domain-containing protein [Hugenholtzia roseola]
MNTVVQKIQYFFEKNAFGVCSRLGERLHISSNSIRLSFIYVSFITFGSPIFVYLFLAFWLHLRRNLRRYRQLIQERC